VRAAKGHDIDPTSLAYKAGDTYLASARLKSNQAVIFLDSTGRGYSLPAMSLPSARGQGEPLTGKLTPPPGARFVAVLGGEGGQRVILASDAGYGFVTTLDDLQAKPKGGKAVLSLPAGLGLCHPRWCSTVVPTAWR
jgi:topoisomerase-4 subunit A